MAFLLRQRRETTLVFSGPRGTSTPFISLMM
jgi:hypothetical protein